MHRVYNSAFMNMIKKEENAKYRETIRNTQEFDKDILKRFVNFMNNPDEETAVTQFGKGDKYFGACTLMATLPGLPMFGHGQLEGFEEKYGMEYRRAYRDEVPDRALLERHEREIFPLLKRRRLFSGVERFLLYDLVGPGGVNDNVFAYSNGDGPERALVVYNNAYERAEGHIRESCHYAEKLLGGQKRMARSNLASALGLAPSSGTPATPRFCVMREQRAELWFIRRSREIAEGGLKIILNGYQSQVFLDFFEVEDDERGLYSAVYDALGGEGTPDFSAAVQDVALKEVYTLLSELTRPLLAWADSLRFPYPKGARAAAKGSPTNASFIKSVAPPALAFYSKTRSLMREEAAEEGLPGDALAGKPIKGVKAIESSLAKKDEAAAKAGSKRLASSLKALASLCALPKAAADKEAAKLLASELALPGAIELSLAYAVLDGIKALCFARGDASCNAPEEIKRASEGARRIVDRYCFDRKLREALRNAGMPGDEAYKGITLAKAFLSKLGNASPGEPELASVVSWVANDEELRAILGVNLFGGVTWFNKERFEEAAKRGALYAALGQEIGSDGLEPARCAIMLIAAAAKAGYSLDALTAAYAPPTRASPSPKAKKTVGTKKASAKKAVERKESSAKAATPKKKKAVKIETKKKNASATKKTASKKAKR
jgi:hypothetical protein